MCHSWVICIMDTGWRRFIGSPKLQIIFHKRATKYRSLLRKMPYKDKGSYESSLPCTHIGCLVDIMKTHIYEYTLYGNTYMSTKHRYSAYMYSYVLCIHKYMNAEYMYLYVLCPHKYMYAEYMYVYNLCPHKYMYAEYMYLYVLCIHKYIYASYKIHILWKHIGWIRIRPIHVWGGGCS